VAAKPKSQDVQVITLAGKEWKIPKMALRQNRELQPLYGQIAPSILREGTRVDEITPEQLDILARIAFLAANRADPNLTEEEFEEMPVGLAELIEALMPIMIQSGLFKKREDTPGETQGETSPQAGTES